MHLCDSFVLAAILDFGKWLKDNSIYMPQLVYVMFCVETSDRIYIYIYQPTQFSALEVFFGELKTYKYDIKP